jgi:hypothetical protein
LRDTEQQGDKAEYGVRPLEHLSEDLQRKLGSGFSERNLYRMREFYLAYSILPAPAKLNWPIIELRGDKNLRSSALICGFNSVFIRVNSWYQSFRCGQGLRRVIRG